jgi:hypothetical protein
MLPRDPPGALPESDIGGQTEVGPMRRSGGGCYEIAGAGLRRVTDGPAEPVALERWRERQSDLWTESGTLAHVDRHMTAEESGLWHAMWTELQVVDAEIERLEGRVERVDGDRTATTRP